MSRSHITRTQGSFSQAHEDLRTSNLSLRKSQEFLRLQGRISILATSEKIQTTLTVCTKLAVYRNQAPRHEFLVTDGFGRNPHERSVTEHAA